MKDQIATLLQNGPFLPISIKAIFTSLSVGFALAESSQFAFELRPSSKISEMSSLQPFSQTPQTLFAKFYTYNFAAFPLVFQELI